MIDAAYMPDPNAQRPPRSSGEAAALRSRRDRAKTRAPGSRRSRSFLTGFASGFAGFVIGAVFWHFVGFWSFVSEVILKGPHEDPKVRAEAVLPAQQPIKVSGRLKDAVRFRDLGVSANYLQAAVGAGNCAEVRVDRATGLAAVQACALAGQLPTAAQGEKADRLADNRKAQPAGWTVQVQAGD